MKSINNPLKFPIAFACLSAIIYFGIKIYKEIKPLSAEEKKMECLRLGSDARARYCLQRLE